MATEGELVDITTEETDKVTPVVDLTPAPKDQPPKVDFKVWNPPQSGAGTPQTLPDSYFEPTAAEVVSAYQSQARRSEALVNAPLKTQSMRDSEMRVKLARYPTTTIRVKFPDMTQLERTFPSTDKIKSIYAFVRNSLRDDIKPIKFVLYQSPPRREFKVSDPAVRDLTLFQLQLAPSSVLLLSFFDDSLNHPSVRAPLLDTILAQAVDLPPPPVFDDPTPSGSRSSGKAKTMGLRTSDGERKVPKWFKIGQKK